MSFKKKDKMTPDGIKKLVEGLGVPATKKGSKIVKLMPKKGAAPPKSK
jgi:hypothetical protein